jgi:hypothetical protein
VIGVFSTVTHQPRPDGLMSDELHAGSQHSGCDCRSKSRTRYERVPTRAGRLGLGSLVDGGLQHVFHERAQIRALATEQAALG